MTKFITKSGNAVLASRSKAAISERTVVIANGVARGVIPRGPGVKAWFELYDKQPDWVRAQVEAATAAPVAAAPVAAPEAEDAYPSHWLPEVQTHAAAPEPAPAAPVHAARAAGPDEYPAEWLPEAHTRPIGVGRVEREDPETDAPGAQSATLQAFARNFEGTLAPPPLPTGSITIEA